MLRFWSIFLWFECVFCGFDVFLGGFLWFWGGLKFFLFRVVRNGIIAGGLIPHLFY